MAKRKLQESMDRCTGRHDRTETMLKMVSNMTESFCEGCEWLRIKAILVAKFRCKKWKVNRKNVVKFTLSIISNAIEYRF